MTTTATAAPPRRRGHRHPTGEERAAAGRAARAVAPRTSLAAWEAAPDREPAMTTLQRQAETRVPELVPIRYGRMVASPFAFYRGAAAIMAADLAGSPRTGLEVQLCGDAHLSNFGAFAAPDRRLVFSINDFDETLPGPFEWDVKRLVASFAVAGRQQGFSAQKRRSIVMAAAGAYRRGDALVRRDELVGGLVHPPRRRRHRPAVRRRTPTPSRCEPPSRRRQGGVEGPA